MHIFIIVTLLLSHIPSFSMSWSDILREKYELIQKHGCGSLVEMEKNFRSRAALTIANPTIKSIPIIESGEGLTDVAQQLHRRLYMLAQTSRPFSSPDCNSGFACGSQVRASVFGKLRGMVGHLDELALEFGYNPGSIDIAVFEGLRSIEVQKKLFDDKREEIRKAHPEFSEEQVDAETAKWVSPTKNNVPVHSTGAAVDIRLKKDGEFLDLGKFGVIWGANPTAPTFSEDLTREQKMNRLFVLMAAKKAGLTNYLYEFWHFSHGDRYDAHWNGLPTAKYGSV